MSMENAAAESCSSSSVAAAACQRYYAPSKRVPKDVKRFCGICRQHGKMEETRGHVCAFKDCECPKCKLVRSRRQVMSQQIRLRRAQDRRFQRTTEPEKADVMPLLSGAGEIPVPTTAATITASGKEMCYFCQKCKNHSILMFKKDHKRQCPFTNCSCNSCELIETRRKLDQHIKRRKSEPQHQNKKSKKSNVGGGGGEATSDGDEEEDTMKPRKNSSISLPAKIESFDAIGGGGGSTMSSDSSTTSSEESGSNQSTLFECCAIPFDIARSAGTTFAALAAQQQQQQDMNPLDALAAHISRLQQKSPVEMPPEQQQTTPRIISPASSIANGNNNISTSPFVMPMQAMPSATPNQTLLNQLLLSTLTCSSAASSPPSTSLCCPIMPATNRISPPPAMLASPNQFWGIPSAPQSVTSATAFGTAAAAQLPLLPTVQQLEQIAANGIPTISASNSPSMQQQIAAVNSILPQLIPNLVPSASSLMNDAVLLNQIAWMATTTTNPNSSSNTMFGTTAPQTLISPLGQQGRNGDEETQQKDFLIQMIAQLLQDQQQQQQNAMLDAMNGEANAIQRLLTKMEPSTATALLLAQQQQQQPNVIKDGQMSIAPAVAAAAAFRGVPSSLLASNIATQQQNVNASSASPTSSSTTIDMPAITTTDMMTILGNCLQPSTHHHQQTDQHQQQQSAFASGTFGLH